MSVHIFSLYICKYLWLQTMVEGNFSGGGVMEQHLYVPFQWQEVITGFRAGMPRHKKRLKMRLYENCFTGSEAVEWLHSHLQSTGLFGSTSRQQVGN